MKGLIIDRLVDLLGDRVSKSISDREHHGRDPGHSDSLPPDLVVYPRTNLEVSEIVKLCADEAVPIVPYGVGSSLEQQVAAPKGGVCIDMSQMNQIVELNQADMDVKVQAGVTRKSLNSYLRDSGLFFPIDPGADATIGGMTATRASGTNAVRYGTMKTNVIGLTIVTPDGEIIHTGGRARKSAAGYDLTALYVGSEGTLGVITEVILRLHPIPEKIVSAVVSFNKLEEAVTSVIETLQSAIPIARVELLDQVQMEIINQNTELDYPNLPTLFLEFHGSEMTVKEQIDSLESITKLNNGSDFLWAEKTEDRNKLWAARHHAYYTNRSIQPGNHMLTTDVCVPISKLLNCLIETRIDLDKTGLVSPIIGHVGDGNFHVMILYSKEQTEIANLANHRLIERALSMGGTCTGEHGIGMGKREFLIAEHGASIKEMKKIKKAFDPKNIMNPGKIFAN